MITHGAVAAIDPARLLERLSNIGSTCARTEEKVDSLNQELSGVGDRPGLINRVFRLETKLNRIIGGLILAGAVASYIIAVVKLVSH